MLVGMQLALLVLYSNLENSFLLYLAHLSPVQHHESQTSFTALRLLHLFDMCNCDHPTVVTRQ